MKLNTLIIASVLTIASMQAMDQKEQQAMENTNQQDDSFRKLALEMKTILREDKANKHYMWEVLAIKVRRPQTISSPCPYGFCCYKTELERQCEHHARTENDDLQDISRSMLTVFKDLRSGNTCDWICCCPHASLVAICNSCTLPSQKIQPLQSNQMQ